MRLGDSRYPEDLDNVSRTSEGQETHRCQNKRTAKLVIVLNLTSKGTAGAFLQSYYRYDNRCVNVKKGSISGISMVLVTDMVFNYCFSSKAREHEWLHKNH